MEIQITARKITGAEVATVPMQSTETVMDLKNSIASTSKISASKQRLLFGTTVLLNNTKLGEAFPAMEAVEVTMVICDKWAHEVDEDWKRLRKAPMDMRNDPEVVRQAMAKSQGEALKFAGSEVRQSKDIVFEAMQYSVSLAQYADPVLGDDLDFMLAAGDLLVTAPPDRIRDAGLQRWGWEKLPALCDNRNFVLAMAHVSGYSALRAAVPRLCKDREVVLAAISSSGIALQFADSELQADAEVVRTAIRKAPDSLKYASMELRADREMALYAMQQQLASYSTRTLLDCVAPELRRDREIVTIALRRKGADLEFVADELKCDKELINLAIEVTLCGAVQHIPKAIQLDHAFILPHLRARPNIFRELCDAAKADRTIALEAVKSRGHLLEHASDELRGDIQVVLAAVRCNPDAVKFAKHPADESAEIALQVVKKDWRIFKILPPKLKDNRDVAMAALRRKGSVQGNVQKMSLSAMVDKLCEP